MLKEIKRFSEKNHMIEKQDRIVIGVSGGADSVCLLFVLLEWKKEYDLFLQVVHVNHGIRGEEAKKDADFVEALCVRHGIPCEIVNARVPRLAQREGLSLEEAGRKARYESFQRACEAYHCNKIAVAHNQNDQSETVLLHLFRGSGGKGMGGMAPVRGRIIRPLLETGREDIEAFLKEREIGCRTDESNLEEVYTRNKLRLRLLPYVRAEINERAAEHIAKTAVLLREADEYIEKNALSVFDRIVRCRNGIYFIGARDFNCEDPVIQKRVLLLVLERLAGHLKDIDSGHVESLRALMDKQVGKRISLPYGMEAVREYEQMRLSAGRRDGLSAGEEQRKCSIPVEVPGVVELGKGGGCIRFQLMESGGGREKNFKKNDIIPKNSYTKWFDYDKIKNTVFIRYRQEGDFLQIDGKGGSKKLKSYFIDEKIPREQRGCIPLLADGSHIMWIIGDRSSEAYQVDENTQRILKVQLDGGEKYAGQNQCVN